MSDVVKGFMLGEKKMPGSEHDDELSAGARALRGFEYQVDVSVWAGLALVLDMNLANAITVEPCSQEDIEADLATPNAARPMADLALSKTVLSIQVKYRSGSAWTCKEFADLLKHGSDTRVSAQERLKKSNVRYLLITNAEVTGEAHNFRVRQFGQWPKPAATPANIKKLLPPDGPGRVAIMSFIDFEDLTNKVRAHLLDSFGVPKAKWEACYEHLRSIARAKMSGKQHRVWSFEELAAVIRNFGGSVVTNPDLDDYVRPSNWATLTARLDEKYAVVIAGQSGTGKTKTSTALWENLRPNVPGIERVVVKSMSDIRSASPTNPVLFDIEDPWGKFKFDYDVSSLALEIPNLLVSAQPRRRFIVTTRDDVLEDAGATREISQWAVPLQPDDYTDADRQRLYQSQIPTLPGPLQILAQDHQESPLNILETPLEIRKFFDSLRSNSDNTDLDDRRRIDLAISEAHVKSIENLIVHQVRNRRAEHLAIVVWGLLKANHSLPRTLVPGLIRDLAEQDIRFEQGLEGFLSFFVAGRSLRQKNAYISYYHPRVEAGLQSIVASNLVLAGKVLGWLLDSILDSQQDTHEFWGLSGIARLTATSTTINGLCIKISEKVQVSLDSWLEAKLRLKDTKFEDYLNLATTIGSNTSPIANLARFINNFELTNYWNREATEETTFTDAQLEAIATHPASKSVCEFFIRSILSTGHRNYRADLPLGLTSLLGDLSASFTATTLSIVKHGYNSDCDLLLKGALTNLDGFSHVADAALDYWHTREDSPTDHKVLRLKIENGEYDDEYAEHLMENDDFYSANEILSAYTRELRTGRGWQALQRNSRAKDLTQWWFMAAMKDAPTLRIDHREYSELVRLVYNTGEDDKEESLWSLLSLSWFPNVLPLLIDRIVSGHPDAETRAAAAACLAINAPECFSEVYKELYEQGNYARLIGTFSDLERASRAVNDSKEGYWTQLATWAARTEPALSELVQPFITKSAHSYSKLSPVARGIAQSLRASNVEERLIKIQFGLVNDYPIEGDIKEVLALTDNYETAIVVLNAAFSSGYLDIIEDGLAHRFARVRALSMRQLAPAAPEVLPTKFLAMATDTGKYVRQQLVELMQDRPHPDYLPTLMLLIKDSWTPDRMQFGGNANFPVARQASICIDKVEEIPDAYIEELLEVAQTSDDIVLQRQLFHSLAKIGSARARRGLLDVVLSQTKKNVRLVAGDALFSAEDKLENSIVSAITPDVICTIPEEVAARLVLIVGAKGSLEQIGDLASILGADLERRVLLALLSQASTDSHPEFQKSLFQLLPTGHPIREFIGATPTALLKRDCLNDVGSARAVAVTLQYLSQYFEEPPPAPQKRPVKRRARSHSIPDIE